jgi:hypothetical protein
MLRRRWRAIVTGLRTWARASADSLLQHAQSSELAALAPGRQAVAGSHPETRRPLEALIYDLLDAHHETARLAEGLRWDPEWCDHLEDLRRLQRVTREALSAASPAGERLVDQRR